MKVLIDLDEGLLSLLDAEAAFFGQTRLRTLRKLLTEALRARARVRGEEFPEVEPWTAGVAYSRCGRPSLTPGYAPCRRPPHEDGPCAHDLSFETCDRCSSGDACERRETCFADAEAVYRKGTDVIAARVNDGTQAVILSRPARAAHEAIADVSPSIGQAIASAPVVSDSCIHEPIARGIAVDHSVITSTSVSSISSEAQTVAEERMLDRTAKLVT